MKLRIDKSYGVTPNNVLNNKDLSFKAKGLYGYLQSKPDDRDFAVARIALDTSDGKDGISAGLKELETAGYLVRQKAHNNKGQREIIYILSENPVLAKPAADKTETNKERIITEYSTIYSNKDTVYKEENAYFGNLELHTNLNSKFKEFIDYRRELKKPLTNRGIKLLVNKLNGLGYTDEQLIECINLSIIHNRQSVYELKGNNYKQSNKELTQEEFNIRMKTDYEGLKSMLGSEKFFKMKKVYMSNISNFL